MITADKHVTGRFKFLLPVTIDVKNGKVGTVALDEAVIKKESRHLIDTKYGVQMVINKIKFRAL